MSTDLEHNADRIVELGQRVRSLEYQLQAAATCIADFAAYDPYLGPASNSSLDRYRQLRIELNRAMDEYAQVLEES